MKKPGEFRAFYWSPDYSFCGFATENSIKKSVGEWHKRETHVAGVRINYLAGREVKNTSLEIA